MLLGGGRYIPAATRGPSRRTAPFVHHPQGLAMNKDQQQRLAELEEKVLELRGYL
jgi:hypothetical protein